MSKDAIAAAMKDGGGSQAPSALTPTPAVQVAPPGMELPKIEALTDLSRDLPQARTLRPGEAALQAVGKIGTMAKPGGGRGARMNAIQGAGDMMAQVTQASGGGGPGAAMMANQAGAMAADQLKRVSPAGGMDPMTLLKMLAGAG